MITATSSVAAKAVEMPQFMVSLIPNSMYCATITVLPPPSSAGVMKNPSEKMNTSTPAASTPGSDSGR
ncbi:Uncharacterised protein [Bordetella pertussis]|nr:Uncharacterised protein [Bordetella pertussis]